MIYESQRQRVARGKNLGVTRAQNKGGVGFAFRYYDMAFGVCCSHLASDKKGRYVGLQYVFVLNVCGMKVSASPPSFFHRTKLRKRLRDASDLLSMTTLWKESYKDIDLHYQHHVTIFMGDLNFRMKRHCPRCLLKDLAHICSHEMEERYAGQSGWRRLAYDSVLQAGKGATGDPSAIGSTPDVSFSKVSGAWVSFFFQL